VKAERLEREFAPRGVANRGGLLLFHLADAVALVQRAADEGVPILGVRGFLSSEDATVSPPEQVADFSQAVAEGHGCWQAAEAFIRARDERGRVFSLTLGDDPVEAV
jgi:hypothetical protein